MAVSLRSSALCCPELSSVCVLPSQACDVGGVTSCTDEETEALWLGALP